MHFCLQDGRSGKMSTTYFGESGKNMHCRAKEHTSKFHGKTAHIRNKSAFHKHLVNTHGGREDFKTFSDYFEIIILKSYKRSPTKCVEEWTLIAIHQGEVVNSKSEWHQAKVVRATTRVVQGGADAVRELGRDREGGEDQGRGRAWVQEPRAPGRTPGRRTRGQ